VDAAVAGAGVARGVYLILNLGGIVYVV
jgi:hypothetical protein